MKSPQRRTLVYSVVCVYTPLRLEAITCLYWSNKWIYIYYDRIVSTKIVKSTVVVLLIIENRINYVLLIAIF